MLIGWALWVSTVMAVEAALDLKPGQGLWLLLFIFPMIWEAHSERQRMREEVAAEVMNKYEDQLKHDLAVLKKAAQAYNDAAAKLQSTQR